MGANILGDLGERKALEDSSDIDLIGAVQRSKKDGTAGIGGGLVAGADLIEEEYNKRQKKLATTRETLLGGGNRTATIFAGGAGKKSMAAGQLLGA